jgi:hypothetical protein
LDHKQWSSGQIMWVDREKRREWPYPTSASPT